MAEIWLRKYKAQGVQMVFKVKVFDNIDFKFTSPISPMPLPEESGQENILVKMEGNTHTCQLTWLVRDDPINQGVTNTTLSGATQADTKTIFQQLKWFSGTDGFIGRNMDDKYDILIWDNFDTYTSGSLDVGGLDPYNMANGGISSSGSPVEFADPSPPADPDNPADGDWIGLRYKMTGFIRDFNFRTSATEPATFRGTIQFIEGNAVGSYQGAKPDSPQNVRLATSNVSGTSPATHIWVRWIPPAHVGNTALTRYDILYKVNDSDNDFLPFAAATGYAGSSGVHLGTLSSDTEYAIKVRAVNGEGAGRESATRYFSTTAV